MTAPTKVNSWARVMGEFHREYKPFNAAYANIDLTPRPAAEVQQMEDDRRDAQPMRVECFFCDWAATGTVGGTRALAAEHRAAEHPTARRKGRARTTGNGLHSINPEARARGGIATRDGA